MRRLLTLAVVAAIATALLALPVFNSSFSAPAPVSVIVELRDDPGAVYQAKAQKSGATISQAQLQSYRDGLRTSQDQFLAALSSRGISATAMTRDVKNFDGSVAATVPLRYSLVYNGIALRVAPSAISTIKTMPQVKAVHKNELLQTSLNKSVKYINAPSVYGQYAELTQFDDFREGYEGQGINIAIIDTGVDWTHPMFGGDPTPPRLGVAPPTPAATSTNQKVIYYLPLTDTAAYDGFGHGTHVASTAAGYLAQVPGADRLPNTADDIRVHGVAPQAKLMSYKVCSDVGSTGAALGVPLGGCQTADIITAIEDSVSPFTLTGQPKPIAHVINMSLGGGGGPETPSAVAASNASLAGTVVVAASGNSGPGEGTTGSPAAGTHVISVGATTHPGSVEMWSIDVAGFDRIALTPMSGSTAPPASSITAQYVLINDPLVQWPATVAGRIALVKSCLTCVSFADYAAQAQAAGAVAMILIRDEGANAVKTLIPAACISSADGEIMIDAISSTDDNTIDPPDGAVSEHTARVNKFMTDSFMGQMAGFSSRGPVLGLGQVKPDLSAPGVSVLAAVPVGSLLGALATANYLPDPNYLMTTESHDAPNYTAIDGTSMATPHMAGVAALIKQAHLNWTPDMIRTALINTATNMRDISGAAKANGLTADSIIAQGGGLVEVNEALNAKALMGVSGDGLTVPRILGSHSYGEVPVINSRTTHTSPITVTIRDLSGQGGSYNLGVANNRDLQLAGINVATSQPSVNVPAGGEATFTVNATIDGNALRDVMAAKTNGTQVVFEKIQMQWFVTAQRSDGGESLRMPFFFRPNRSLPATPTIVTTSHTDTLPAGDYGTQRDVLGEFVAADVTYKVVPFTVDASTYQIDAKTEWMQVGETGHPDIDYQLLDPDDNVIAQSGNGVGPEFVSIRVERPGTYKHRVIGFTSVATEFVVTTTLRKGNTPPALQAISADFTNGEGKAVDFDGSVNLSWSTTNGATGYEVERSTDGVDYELVRTTAAGQTSLTLAGQPDGELTYRVRALAPGQIGFYVTAASNTSSVIVDRRRKVDITKLVTRAVSSVSLTGGVFQLDVALTSNSSQTYVPFVDLNVVGVRSATGTVKVINADNGKDGKSKANAALFGYSDKLGSDQRFTPTEVSGIRTLRFQDSASEMFTFDAVVTAYVSNGTGGEGGSGSSAAPTGGSQAGGDPSGLLSEFTAVMRFTANPLTKTVTAQLIALK